MIEAQQSRLLQVVEQLIWVMFLAVLMLMTFVSSPFISVPWMLLSTTLFSIATVYLLILLAGTPFNQQAMYQARWIAIIAGLGLVWLFVQSVTPFADGFRTSMFNDPNAPRWFTPKSMISVDPQRTRMVFYAYLVPYCCMLLGLCLINSRARIKQLLLVLLLLSVVHAAGALIAKCQQFFLVDKSQLDGHFTAARGWFVNRNHLAAFLLASTFGVMPLMIKRVRGGSQRLTRLLSALVGSLIVLVVILSQSRAGLAGLFALVFGVVIFVSFVGTRARLGIRLNPKAAMFASLGFSILIFVALVVYGAETLQRLEQSSFGLGERWLQWQITWQAITQSPWFGFGGGSYAAVFQLFREYSDLRQVIFDQSHNDYLHILLEQGVVGLGLWLGFIGMVLHRSINAYRHTRSSLVAAVLLSGCLVILVALMQSLVDFNLQIISLRCYFFVIIAAVLAVPSINHH